MLGLRILAELVEQHAAKIKLMLFFTMSGLNIVKKGGAEQITIPNAPKTLPQFLDVVKGMGARLVACSAAFPLVGVTAAELIEGVELGGVATFVAEAEEADVVLTF